MRSFSSLRHIVQLDIDDLRQVLARQRVKHDDIVNAVQELRPELAAQRIEQALARILVAAVLARAPRSRWCCVSTIPVPTFDVMTITVFLKLTVRPWPSVRRPSSRICSSMLKTSGCAFSISSNSTTEYGRRRTCSVSWPPSS